MIVSLWIFNNTTDRLDRHQKALETEVKQIKKNTHNIALQATRFRKASLIFCEISRQNDAGEARELRTISEGKSITITPECINLTNQIFK
jgi:hypothetical protein